MCEVKFSALQSRLALLASLLLAPGAVVRGNDTISVYPATIYQTFDGFGGNMARHREDTLLTNISTNGTDPVADFCLANLSVKHVRIGMPLIVFEPSKGTFDYSAANVVHVLNLMKYVKGLGIPFSMGIWNVPDWMVTNPTADTGRIIKSPDANTDYEHEIAKAIVTFLNKANTAAYNNAVPDGISFNECSETWGNNVAVPSTKLNKIMTEVAGLSGGANVKWILSDTGASKGDTYAQACWNAMTTANRGKVIAVSYHGWNSLANTAAISTLKTFADSIGKPMWCLEVGEDPQTPGSELGTWAYASEVARNYFNAFKFGRVSKADYWEYMTDYRLTTDANGTAFTKAGYVVKMLNDFIRPGMAMVNSAGTGNGALPLAFKHLVDGRFRVFFINSATAAQSISFNNLPAGTYTWTRCSSTENDATIGTYTVGTAGTLTLSNVPADSVNIISKPVD